jgi:photosystem II stability/assembly factor-like uncharacterized protein
MKKVIATFLLTASAVTGFSQSPYKWDDNVAIGGGGYITGIITHPLNNSIVYARTDVGGAYRLEQPNAQHPTHVKWIPMFDWIPVGSSSLFQVAGIAVAPSDTNIVYAAMGSYVGSPSDVYKSTDRGVTWTAMLLNQNFFGNQTGSERMKGECLAVNPTNPNIVFAGTNLTGLWKYNGTTWTQVPAAQVPLGTSPVGIRSIAIDPNNAMKIYCTSFGNGVYQSTDGGATWSIIAGSPISAGRLKVTNNSILYITCGANVGGTPAAVSPGIYKYKLGVLTTITPPATVIHYTALDADSTQIVCMQSGHGNYNAKIFRSTNEGVTWTTIYPGYNLSQLHSPRNAAWIPPPDAFAGNTSSLVILNHQEVWFGDFTGVFRTLDITAPVTSTTPLFEDLPWGDEELVIDDLASPPSGAFLFVGCYDVCGFRITNPNVIPTAPAWRWTSPHFETFGIDFCESHPVSVVRSSANSSTGTGGVIAKSSDGGITWTDVYTNGVNAKVTYSSSDTNNFLFAAYNYSIPQNLKYTLNGGTTFSNCNGVPATIFNGAFYDAFSKPFTSDRINGSKFYAFSTGTVYVSTDNGVNFSAAATGLPLGGNGTGVPHRVLEASPYTEGDLWLAIDISGLYHSTNSGASFTQNTFFNQCYTVSVGPAIGNSIYPTVFAFGKKAIGNVWGLYRSIDDGATWLRINDNTHQLSNGPRALEADRQTPGRVFMGSGGRGVYMGVDTTSFILPIGLIFTGKIQNNNAVLQWQDQEANNVSRYEMQRSITSNNFTPIAQIFAQQTQLDYTYTDNSFTDAATGGKAFYRLKQISKDGKEEYSNVVLLSIYNSQFTLFPNPANDKVTITFSRRINENVKFDFYAASGQLLQTTQANNVTNQTINVSHLPSGIYTLKISTPQATYTKKLVIER